MPERVDSGETGRFRMKSGPHPPTRSGGVTFPANPATIALRHPARRKQTEMTDAKAPMHTPGPWLVHDKSTLHMNDREIASVGRHIKVVSHTAPDGMRPSEPMFNARLIAAAPALLEALRAMVAVHDEMADFIGVPVVAAEGSALAKACAALALVDGAK